MTARFNSIGDIWNNTNKTTIQTGRPITSDPKLTQLTELMSAFSNGEINFSTLKARLASLDITVNGVTTRASFTYRGKTYNVQQRTSVYSNTKFSSSTLRDIYKLTDEQINTYFTKKSETEYELNKSSGCKTINGVVAKVAQQYQNDMLLANFLNDKNKTTNSATVLKKTSDNKTINSYNYQDYIDEIQSTLGTDTDAAKKKALDKFITDFTQGNVAFATVSAILKAIGVEYKLSNKGSDFGIQFTYDNKTYQLSCKLKAAIQGTDDKTVETYSADSLIQAGATQTLINKYFDSVTTVDGKAQTYALKSYVTYAQFLAEVEKEKAPKTFSYSELKNSYKFTDNIINKYFKKEETANAKPDTGAAASKVYISNTGAATSKVYILNTEAGCKNIAEVEQKMAEQYQKAMVLVNFLNDKNKKTDVVNDMKKAGDGNTITKDNYQKYVDEIKQALGNDEDAIVEKALEKLVKDFTEGNISMNMVSTIADAMGIDSSKAKFSRRGNELGYEIEYKGKTYTMFCMIDALTSGTDDKSLQTYTLSDLQKTEATEEQINKYFYAATTVDGKTTTYHMRSNYTYAQFEEEVKASQKKNGVETSKNAQGYKVETTYVDGVVTKVVEYKKDGKKLAKETEYYANGQVKHETKYVSYSDKKEAETEFYENGKTKSETTYDYYGPTTKEYDEKGTLKIETAYDYYGKNVTTYNSDGSTVKTTYDKETNKPIKEVRTSANGIESYFAIKVADDGSKTVTEHSAGKYMDDYNRVGVEKYDAQGRLIYKSKYISTWSYTDTKYIYNEDGSRREISYDSHSDNTHGNITSDKTYDKNGRLIKSASYPRNNYTLPTTEVLYSYDSNGAISTKTTIEYDIYYGEQRKKSETVTDKNGKVLSKITYERSYQDENTGKYVGKERKIVTTNDGDKSTVATYIANQITQEVVTDSAKNTKTTITYENGKKSLEVITQNNKVISETMYDTNGNVTYAHTIGNKLEELTLTDGAKIAFENGSVTADITDKSGNKIGVAKKTTSKINIGSNASEISQAQNLDCVNIYDNSGNLTSRVVYNTDGTIKTIQKLTYKYTDNNNYKIIIEDLNGDIHTEVYENSKRTTTYHYMHETKTIFAQEEGKTTARAVLKGSATVSASGVTASMTAQQIYDAITDKLDDSSAFAIKVHGFWFDFTGAEIVQKMAGDTSVELLRMAQAGYNGKPSGSDKTYVGYQNAPSNVQAHIKKDLAGTVPEYGYTPEEVKGYHYPTSSAMSKKISTNKNFTNYVNKYIKNLVNGTNLSSTRLDFEQNVDKDLWGSLHGTDVVATKLEGTKLTITIYDLYDFANLQGNSNNDVLNRAGYAAMKDGKLKPYYVLIDVVIDLSKSPYNYTAAQLQAMKV